MKIASFDIGVKNLALCVLDNCTGAIIQWELFSLPSIVDKIPQTLITEFRENNHILSSDIVLVEKQPGKNKTMLRVEAYITMLMNSMGCRCILCSPKQKLSNANGCNFKGKSRECYSLRKRASIMLTSQYLDETNLINHKFLATYKKSAKKDDLADSLLQALSYKNPWSPSVSPVPDSLTPGISASTGPSLDMKTRILLQTRARAPTALQTKRCRYSISNIVHFWKANPSKDAFMKALQSVPGLQKCLCEQFESADHFINAICSI